MDEKLMSDLNSFVGDRLERFDNFETDKQYKGYCSDKDTLIKKIANLLPEKERKLIRELEETFIAMESVENEYIYKHGFKDALKITSM
jgi:hypothetical protein